MGDTIIMEGKKIDLMIERLSEEILGAGPDVNHWVLIGIQRRGADLATRISGKLEKKGIALPKGSLDINLYRDDWTRLADGIPHIGKSTLPQTLTDKTVLLVDDVLFTGRTIRSALEALLDYGRPKSVRLLALIDRGHRELPICPDYVGQYIKTRPDQHVDVLLQERDGQDAIILRD